MADFSQDIKNFEQNGAYDYKFDNVGNMIFNSSSEDFSQVYLAFPLANIFYNNNKLDVFYDPTFQEFIPTIPVTSSVINTDILQQQVDSLQQENVSLTTQLNSLATQNEANSSAADQMATKQVILELRKAAGEGRVDSDFSDTFPYTAIRKPTLPT